MEEELIEHEKEQKLEEGEKNKTVKVGWRVNYYSERKGKRRVRDRVKIQSKRQRKRERGWDVWTAINLYLAPTVLASVFVYKYNVCPCFIVGWGWKMKETNTQRPAMLCLWKFPTNENPTPFFLLEICQEQFIVHSFARWGNTEQDANTHQQSHHTQRGV